MGEDETAERLYAEAIPASLYGRSLLKLNFSQAVAQNLPPSLAATIPQLPSLKQNKTVAIVCSEGSCNPPAHNSEALRELLQTREPAA